MTNKSPSAEKRNPSSFRKLQHNQGWLLHIMSHQTCYIIVAIKIQIFWSKDFNTTLCPIHSEYNLFFPLQFIFEALPVKVFQRIVISQPFLDLLISQGCLAKVSQDYVTREKVCQLCIVDNKRFSNFSESRKMHKFYVHNFCKIMLKYFQNLCSILAATYLTIT